MSYWGSHYSGLDREKEEEEDDPEKNLRKDLSLNKDQLEEIRECFKLYDKSGKGYLSPLEIRSVLNSVGEDPDDEEVREMILEVDEDGNGIIGFIEFIHFMHKRIKQPITDDDMMKCFQVFDEEENGYITIRGLEKVFLSLGQRHTEEELKEMISYIDTSGNEEGLCTFEEFKKYMIKENLVRKKEDEDTKNNTEKNKSSKLSPYGPGSEVSMMKKSQANMKKN